MADILFISPYLELAEIALQIIESQDDIDIKVTRMDEAVALAREAERLGYQVIISRGLTASKIKSSEITIPIVDIRIGGTDILRAYNDARKLGNIIGIVDVEEVILGLPSLEKIIDDKFIKYTCKNDLDDVVKGIESLKERGVEVVIGKIAMAREARLQGMEAVVITSAYETVRMAILEARRVNEVRKQEKRKAEQLKVMLSFTYDGVIALDKFGKITVFNKVAEDLSGWSAADAINREVTEVIPKAGCQHLLKSGKPELGAVLEIGKSKVVANRVPIVVDGKIEGVVTTFQKLDVLQKIESNVRIKLSDKGLSARYCFDDIIGASQVLKNTIDLAVEYATIDSTVLIYGQTGTGKEIFAHAIHSASKRRSQPFVAINCAALPESILESELFGYVEGAFTGARKGGKAGVFEMAHGGTLLLDEVGEMPPMLQSRFLRVIEQREIMRLGDSRIIPVNVRLVVSTHRNLKEMVTQGQFREDLYYRFNVLSLPVPTLKERGKDVLEIADRFLREFYDMQGKSYGIFSDEASKLLIDCDWPGNIRQLRNTMERLSVMTAGGLIGVEDVSRALQIQDFTDTPGDMDFKGSLFKADQVQIPGTRDYSQAAGTGVPLFFEEKAAYEREIIYKVLKECHGSKTRAAQKLGISRTTLWRKLQQFVDN